ncbi:MAG: M20 family metallopeptidase [Chloroflexi bacterium]|nr:M20 family metallopeptidase [Chloroflexota bacterium]
MKSLRTELENRLDVKDVVDVASALVSIESHRDAPGRERPCAEKIAEIFTRWGMQPQIVNVIDERPNVYCHLTGSGGGKTLMLNGHIDTVPAYQMTIPPFQPYEDKGLLYGRGTVDMKGALACMMTAMRILRDLGVPLKGDVIFAAVINEEDRSEGTEFLVRNGPTADRCVVGEPTGMEIMVGHRGLEWLEFEFIGVAAHGGTPHKGVNAISKAARFIRRVEDQLMPELAKRVHPIIGPAVMNFGVIRGGTQPSSVADRCILQMDRRWIPQETLEQVLGDYRQILRQMEDEDPTFKCTMTRMESNMATMDHYPMEIALDDPLVTGLQSILKDMGIQPKISAFGGWTDASLISNFAHIPTTVFGPGDLSVAHSRCEYVPVEELRLSTIAYALLAADICNQDK